MNSKAKVRVQLLGESGYSKQIKADSITEFDTGHQPSPLSSIDIYSEQPWPSSITFVEIALTMRPQLEYHSIVEITFDPNFTIKEDQLECEDLFNNKIYECSINDSILQVSYDKNIN